MDIASICILGGSGLVGAAIADQACARGYRVRVVTRNTMKTRPLLVLPTLEVRVADPNDEAALERCLEGMDAAVNLVGILHPGGRTTFESAHVDLPRKLVQACRSAGVQRLLHMSALGASPTGPSEYLRSKAGGEAVVRNGPADLSHTIFRPSVIFGERDRFLNLFAQLARFFPVIPLAHAQARFQPIWVEDVARCFVASLEDPRTFGQVYELGGPRAYALEDLVRFVCETLGVRRSIVALPDALAQLQALVFERLPGKLITRDNLRSMSIDNVCAGPFPPVFGFAPACVEVVAPAYLGAHASRYDRYRHQAGR